MGGVERRGKRTRFEESVTAAVAAYAGMSNTVVAILELLRRRSLLHADDNQWLGKVPGSAYIRHQTLHGVRSYLRTNPKFPGKIFRERFHVPRALFAPLLSGFCNHDVPARCTKFDAIDRVGIYSSVTVLVCLKRLGKGTSLSNLKDGTEMEKETIRKYMMRFLNDV